MESDSAGSSGMLSDISEHLGAIFRHMLPGVILVGGAALAYPDMLGNFKNASWQYLLVLAVITVAAGNTWFALNRYGPHQLLDYALYLCKVRDPARASRYSYLDDLGLFVHRSLHADDPKGIQHVRFRASAMLLLWTVGEAAWLFSYIHSDKSLLVGHEVALRWSGAIAFLIGTWQMIITRRIDCFIVSKGAAASSGKQWD